jgi:hypothetical protein
MSLDAGNITNYNFRHFFLRKATEKMEAIDSATILPSSDSGNGGDSKSAEEDG